jgi:2-amino-4-hydroxy-6-hydroxymethyldihydropteridine diphosphokinase
MQTAYIGMGANLDSPAGSPDATLAAAAERLGSLGRLVCRSSLYSTAPVGYADQPRFLNAVIALATDLPPRALLESLLAIEREFGRDRSAGIVNGPRTLDLDILLYGDRVIREKDLEIPHPRLGERAFVLIPLAEIASNVVDGSRQQTVSQLLHALETGLPENADAVVPIQSNSWRSGACGGSLAAWDAPCPDSSPDADRRG